jgi:hypothetical protein
VASILGLSDQRAGPNAPAENEEMPMQPHAVMPEAPERKNIAAAAMLFVFGL